LRQMRLSANEETLIPMTKSAPQDKDDEIAAPAVISNDMRQDRTISPVAGAQKAWRRLDGLACLRERKQIARHQVEAGTRLQDDWQESLMEGGSRGGGVKTDGGRGSYEIPQRAIDARGRVKQALAILPPELLTMTILFLLPDFREQPLNLERIGQMVKEDKRSITLGIRASLSLLARHYGYCG
jgi:hypothetical protein